MWIEDKEFLVNIDYVKEIILVNELEMRCLTFILKDRPRHTIYYVTEEALMQSYKKLLSTLELLTGVED